MKYLFVHDHILRKIGNDYYSTGGLSNDVMHRYLNNKNDTITLYTRQIEATKEEKGKLVIVNDKQINCIPSEMYHSPKDYLKKRKIIKNEIRGLVEKSDFVFLRVPSFLGYFVYDEVKRQNKKYVIEMVACPWDSLWNHSSILGKILAPLMYLKTKKVCKEAKNIIYVSEEFLQNRYPTKGNSLGCSDVNIENVDDVLLKQRLDKIKKKKDLIRIGLVGSLNVNFKGHKEAILMVRELKKKDYKVELHCLGGGEAKRWIEFAEKNGVSKNVFFDGTLPSGDPVFKWFDSLDIYVIPSLQEGLPRALVEAMSRACPAVGMRTGGIPELINKDFVCKRKDYKEMAKKVELLINDKELMANTATENFNKAKNFVKSKLEEKRKNFITKIIEGD